MSEDFPELGRAPVPAAQARVESIGVNPLDLRRVDVAVDLTPCQEPLTVRLVIVGPDDQEWSSASIIQNREWMLDRILHLRRDAESGTYTLHVGIFREEVLVHRTSRQYAFPGPE